MYLGRDFFVCVLRGEIQPQTQWNLGALFHNFEKKIPNFLFEDSDFTHTSYMVTFYYHCILFLIQFNGNSICTVIANLFLIDQKCTITNFPI